MRIFCGFRQLTSKPVHVVIAGGGIGGLTAALALARAHIRVTVLERANRFEDVGAGLQLSPNSSRILASLGVLEHLRGAVEPAQLHIRRASDGATLATMALGASARLRWGAPMLVAHRSDVHQALLACLAQRPEIDVQCGLALTGFEADSQVVTMAARQGTTKINLVADALIGADGLHSQVRTQLQPGGARIYSNRTAWRAMIPAQHAPAFARELETCLWLGDKAHLVHYPLRGGSLVNVVAIISDDWRATGVGDLWAQTGDAAYLAARFGGWHKPARALIDAAPSWNRWPLFDRAPLSHWNAGRVAVLGDAAHPMLPFLAQGAAQAIEDAQALGGAFAALPQRDIAGILARYSASRSARAAKVQKHSRWQGQIYHLAGPAALARDLALRWLGPQNLARRNDWLYGLDANL